MLITCIFADFAVDLLVWDTGARHMILCDDLCLQTTIQLKIQMSVDTYIQTFGFFIEFLSVSTSQHKVSCA